MVEYSFSTATFESFLMVLVRIASFVFVAPFFSMTNTPARVKVGFSLLVAILLYQLVMPGVPLEYSGIFGYTAMVLKEGITGLLIGFAASICSSIVLLAGKIIDMDIGLAMAQIFDPVEGTTSGLTGNFYNYLILLLLLATNMHHFILRALIDSFEVIPLGGAVFHWDGLLLAMTRFMGDMMVIAFRIVLPVWACIMVVNSVLGILAKLSPQMNMFAVGIELKLITGLTVLFLTAGLLPNIANFVFQEMRRMMAYFIEAMSPLLGG